MKHVGILAHSTEGAALCFLTFCQEGFRRLGRNEHPDVTLDCIAFGYSIPAWDAGDYGPIRARLAVSAHRLARAGADFFACPDNAAHMALEEPGEDLALPGLHIAEVVAGQAARDRRQRVGVLGTRYLMDGLLYTRVFAAHGIAAEVPGAEDRRVIHEIIFDELVNGVFKDSSRQEYVRVIEQLAARGCDAGLAGTGRFRLSRASAVRLIRRSALPRIQAVRAPRLWCWLASFRSRTCPRAEQDPVDHHAVIIPSVSLPWVRRRQRG